MTNAHTLEELNRLIADKNARIVVLEEENARLRTSREHWMTAYEQSQTRVAELERQLQSSYAFEQSVNEALNMGDGSYRP